MACHRSAGTGRNARGRAVRPAHPRRDPGPDRCACERRLACAAHPRRGHDRRGRARVCRPQGPSNHAGAVAAAGAAHRASLRLPWAVSLWCSEGSSWSRACCSTGSSRSPTGASRFGTPAPPMASNPPTARGDPVAPDRWSTGTAWVGKDGPSSPMGRPSRSCRRSAARRRWNPSGSTQAWRPMQRSRPEHDEPWTTWNAQVASIAATCWWRRPPERDGSIQEPWPPSSTSPMVTPRSSRCSTRTCRRGCPTSSTRCVLGRRVANCSMRSTNAGPSDPRMHGRSCSSSARVSGRSVPRRHSAARSIYVTGPPVRCPSARSGSTSCTGSSPRVAIPGATRSRPYSGRGVPSASPTGEPPPPPGRTARGTGSGCSTCSTRRTRSPGGTPTCWCVDPTGWRNHGDGMSSVAWSGSHSSRSRR